MFRDRPLKPQNLGIPNMIALLELNAETPLEKFGLEF